MALLWVGKTNQQPIPSTANKLSKTALGGHQWQQRRTHPFWLRWKFHSWPACQCRWYGMEAWSHYAHRCLGWASQAPQEPPGSWLVMMHGKKRVEKCFVYLKSGTVSLATVGLLRWKSLLSPLTFFISNRPQALIRVCFPFFFCFPSHIQYSFFLFVCFFEAIPENRWMWAPMAQTSIIMSTRISSIRTVTASAKRRLLVALGGWPRRSRIWRRTSHRGTPLWLPPEFPPFLIGEKKLCNKSMWVFSEILSSETYTGWLSVRRLWVVCSQRVRPTRISRPFAMWPPGAFHEKIWHKTIATSTVLKQEGCDNGNVKKRGLLKEHFGYLLKNCLSFCYRGEDAWTCPLWVSVNVVEMQNLMQEMPKLSNKHPSKMCLLTPCSFCRWLERRTHPTTCARQIT